MYVNSQCISAGSKPQIIFFLHFVLYGTSRKEIQYWIQQKEELIEVTNKMNNITFHHGKVGKVMPHEVQNFDYVLFKRALENAITRNKVIFKQ